jgi:hypothetical protein
MPLPSSFRLGALLLPRAALVLALALAAGGCDTPPAPNAAEATYGEAPEADDALPLPAVWAEAGRYDGRVVTVEGRIAAVERDGCTLRLAGDGGPAVRVAAPGTAAAGCSWAVPDTTRGLAVARGTLRRRGDAFVMRAPGVRVLPFDRPAPPATP